MIFGFNTDVRLGEVIFHVQSEARHKELLLQTQVFVKGQCIGKCASPYLDPPALQAKDPAAGDGELPSKDFPKQNVSPQGSPLGELPSGDLHTSSSIPIPGSHGLEELRQHADEETQQRLKEQHRRIVEAVRGGTLQQELEAYTSSDPSLSSLYEAMTADAMALPGPAGAPGDDNILDLGDLVDSESPSVEQNDSSKSIDLSDLNDLSKPDNSSKPDKAIAAASAPVPSKLAAPLVSGLAAIAEGESAGIFCIECLNAGSVLSNGGIKFVLQVTRDRQPVDGAELTLRLVLGQAHSQYSYGTTDSKGVAEVAIAVDRAAGQQGRVLVQASSQGASSVRRFRVHPPSC
jgi:hypothetical protein